MFVLTHPHDDHYCSKGIAAYLAAGKPVVLPCGLDKLKMPDGVSGAGQNCIVMLAKCPPADVIIASTWNRVRAMVGACAAASGFDRSKAVLIPSHENEITHGVSNRESYWEMYERKDRLGGKSFPWPQVRPLGYGESIVVGCE